MTARRDQQTRTERGVRWGVRCADDEVLWVDGEAAAHRLLASLIGAQYVVIGKGLDEET